MTVFTNWSPVVTVPSGTTDVQIQEALNSLASTGGTVQLQAGTYTVNNPINLVNNVSIVGVPVGQTSLSSIVANNYTLLGGTILTGSGITCFQSNSANLTTAGTWASGGLPVGLLSGVRISDLGFNGFTNGIVIGGQNNAGCTFSIFENLQFYGITGWAMILKNFSEIRVKHIYVTKSANGGKFQSAIVNTVDQMGNSLFYDLNFDQQGTNQNFQSPWVFGVDSGVANAQLNEIHAWTIAVYNSARTTTSTTATLSGVANIALTAGQGVNFPVGMPVQFSTISDGSFVQNRTYFVISQVSDTIQVANSRGGSAIVAAGSSSPTILQQGLPLLDLGGTNTSVGAIVNSTFREIDVEGPACGACYLENAIGVNITYHEITATAKVDFCSRSNSYVWVSGTGSQPMVADVDGFNPGTHRIDCPVKSFNTNNIPAGLYYDSTNAVWSLMMSATGGTSPSLIQRGTQGGFMAPLLSMGQKISSAGSSFTLDPSTSGLVVCTSASAITLTLPTLSSNYGTGNSGLRYEIVAFAAGTVTVTGAANTLFGGGAISKTSASLAQGSSAVFTAVPGGFGWMITANNGGTFT